LKSLSILKIYKQPNDTRVRGDGRNGDPCRTADSFASLRNDKAVGSGFLALALGTDSKAGVRAVVEISGGLAEPYAGDATAAFPSTLILPGDADTVVPLAGCVLMIAGLWIVART
jgi:hypothetical protein